MDRVLRGLALLLLIANGGVLAYVVAVVAQHAPTWLELSEQAGAAAPPAPPPLAPGPVSGAAIPEPPRYARGDSEGPAPFAGQPSAADGQPTGAPVGALDPGAPAPAGPPKGAPTGAQAESECVHLEAQLKTGFLELRGGVLGADDEARVDALRVAGSCRPGDPAVESLKVELLTGFEQQGVPVPDFLRAAGTP